ncbi:MAG: SDR family oxidoreductase [Deltaproteobacteria bacterium]|nr:SDR family oxidoreductase [Deltaproteobacteria bacterium]MBW2079032.1 SDR family oxidoreductase [Deltaproteobacteria bacterium]MBW2312250.1 SDR family oxidoreductase [Deltaproteobacteria bacterium]
MAAKDMDFSGKVALVTGGSKGLGEDIALAMAERGAQVAICSRKKENLDQAQEEFKKRGLEVMARDVNVGRSDEVRDLIKALDEKFGKLDILVNNVGTNILTPSVAEADEGLWDKIMATSLKSAFLVSSHGIALMKRAGGGKIINISSIAARKASRGMGIYCVAKAGLEMLTRVMAVELAAEHINVNAVAPSMIRTGFSQPLWSNEGLYHEILKTIPMGRIAETNDVVGAALFLASGMSDFVTGEVVTVDGGSMA